MDHKTEIEAFAAFAAYCDATDILLDAFDRVLNDAPWWRRLPWPGNWWLKSLETLSRATDYTIDAAHQHLKEVGL